MNSVNLVGRLTSKPELRYTPGGTAVSKFNLAVDKELSKVKKAEYQAQDKRTADFPRIVVWGKPAENCEKYLDKGSLIYVVGSVSTGYYDREDGTRVFTTEVNSRRVGFLGGRTTESQKDETDEIHWQEVDKIETVEDLEAVLEEF